MQLISNSISSRNVREIERDGTRYFKVENVPFIRATELANGYVPEQHVAESVDEWDGVPLTLNHPRTAGNVVSANTTEGKRVTVGEAENPRQIDDGDVGAAADLTINADRAIELGEDGEALVEALESGDGLEVSSQFFGDTLPPGEYDGEQRDRVEGNVRPDSIALLPSKKGVCTLPDCGIAPGAGASKVTANGDTHLSVTAEPLPSDAWDDVDDGGIMAAVTRGVSAALSRRSRGSGDTPADAATANSGGCGCGCGGTCADGGDGEHSDADEPADTGSGDSGGSDDPTSNRQMVDIPRERVIESTAENTGLDADALGELDDDALTTLYEQGATGDGGAGGQQQAGDPGADPANGDDEPTANGVDTDEIVDQVVDRVTEQLSANSEHTEKAELADEIVANSADHSADDRDELVDAPKGVLESLRDSVVDTGGAGLPGTHGAATANSAGVGDADDVDLDEFGSGVIGDD